MGNKLTLVIDEDISYEWVYINGTLKYTGEPIDADQWLEIVEKYGRISVVEKYYLTEEFGEKVEFNYNKIPQNFSEFTCEDVNIA